VIKNSKCAIFISGECGWTECIKCGQEMKDEDPEIITNCYTWQICGHCRSATVKCNI